MSNPVFTILADPASVSPFQAQRIVSFSALTLADAKNVAQGFSTFFGVACLLEDASSSASAGAVRYHYTPGSGPVALVTGASFGGVTFP